MAAAAGSELLLQQEWLRHGGSPPLECPSNSSGLKRPVQPMYWSPSNPSSRATAGGPTNSTLIRPSGKRRCSERVWPAIVPLTRTSMTPSRTDRGTFTQGSYWPSPTDDSPDSNPSGTPVPGAERNATQSSPPNTIWSRFPRYSATAQVIGISAISVHRPHLVGVAGGNLDLPAISQRRALPAQSHLHFRTANSGLPSGSSYEAWTSPRAEDKR
jgi:hypothetical protein